MPGKNDAQVKAEQILAVVRQLSEESHDARDYSLSVSLDSGLERDLGFDSLTRVELLSRIERRLQVHLSEQVLARAESPRDLLRAVQAAGSPAAKTPAPAEGGDFAEDEIRPAGEARTLVEVLDWHAASHPRHLHINLYEEGEVREKISFSTLREEAEEVAAGLQWHGVAPGETVALMLPSSRGYFASFFGVLLAGAIPVPLYPPARPAQIEEHLRRHTTILENCRAGLLITMAEVKPLARLLKARVPSLKDSLTVAELRKRGQRATLPSLTGEDIAFLQYTSGSTGSPKGVVLTHANLLANIRAMGEVIRATPEDVFVSWLPLYHDMGLIGAWLGSLYFGCQLVIMSPLSFLVHPENWLWAIHRHRGTLSASPNFGYEFCLKKIDDRDIEGLDLGSWRLAFNGAEPVSPETVRRFPERFKPYGFRAEAMTPVYGLAESSVGLAFPEPGRKPVIDRVERETFSRYGKAVPAKETDHGPLRFVCCGRPLPGHAIRILDPQGEELGERREGRLVFRGPSATSGYFRNPGQTGLLFTGEWLDSGDLAYLAEGAVYITSRVKDIIIRGGRNIYAHELEEAVGKVEGIRKGCVAVFGSPDRESKTERLVVVAESRETAPDVMERLHAAVNNQVSDLVGLPPDDVVLVPAHTVLKTSSGKVRRAATRKAYEEGGLGRTKRAVWWQLLRVAARGLPSALGQGLKELGAWFYAAYCWTIFLVLAVPVWLLVAILPGMGVRWAVIRFGARSLARLTLTRLAARGMDNIPRDRPVVLAANHQSYLDSLMVVAVLPVAVSFVAKSELTDRFVPRLFLSRLGVEFVDRFDVELGASGAERLTRKAGHGRSLFFFPEGTFHRMPGLLPFYMGAFTTAVENDMMLVPVTIRGTRQLLPSRSWRPRRGAVIITAGRPLAPSGGGWAAALNLRQAARREILRLCGEADLAGTRAPLRGKRKQGSQET